jgi:predicted amidophosphoribosyltransferase
MDKEKKNKPMPCAGCGKNSEKRESLCRECSEQLHGKQVAWEAR